MRGGLAPGSIAHVPSGGSSRGWKVIPGGSVKGTAGRGGDAATGEAVGGLRARGDRHPGSNGPLQEGASRAAASAGGTKRAEKETSG